MTKPIPSTQCAHNHWREVLHSGDFAIDATLGNAKDTEVIAQYVGSTGHVWAFEIQGHILEKSRQYLLEADLLERITLFHQGHETLFSAIPPIYHSKIKLIVFNLGYCPGADKAVITQSETTLAALQAATKILAKDGLISLMAYRGHPGGLQEYQQIKIWLQTLNKNQWQVEPVDFTRPGSQTLGPVLFLLKGKA